jgi:O-antigen ligase
MVGSTSWWIARGCLVVLVAVPQAAWHLQSLPWPLHLAQIAALGVAVGWPPGGLLLLGGAGPVIMSVSGLLGDPGAGSRLIEQLALGCVTAAIVRTRADAPRTRLAGPAVLVAVCAAVSFWAEWPSRLLALATGEPGEPLVRRWLETGYFGHPTLWEPAFYATLAIEGAGLAWATERLMRDHRRAWSWTLSAAIGGHVLAGLLNLDRLITAARRAEEFWPGIWSLLSQVRFSIQYDKNAAGAVFAMMVFVALGRAIVGSRWHRTLGWTAAALLVVAVIITGSRMAMLAVVAGVFTCLVAVAAARWWLWPVLAMLLAVGAVAASAFSVFYGERTVENAVAGRQLLATAALRAASTSPWFGIGIGTFYERSFELGGDEMIVLVGSGNPRENAHNNYLQVLAEQGIVGLAAWITLLAAGLFPAVRAIRSASPGERLLTLAVLVFAGTWLTGHPMLVPEAAFMFWLVFGTLTATTHAPGGSWPRRVTLAAAIAVAASTPWRMDAERRSADLEHRGLGVSVWERDAATRYRVAASRFTLFLPSGTRGVFIPARRPADGPDVVRVEARLDGRLLNAVLITGDEWKAVRFSIPSSAPRFAAIDFDVADARTGAPVEELMVGRARPLLAEPVQ